MLTGILAFVCAAAIALNIVAAYEILVEENTRGVVTAGWLAAVTFIPVVGAIMWLRWCSPLVLAHWPHLRAAKSLRPSAAEVDDLHTGLNRLIAPPAWRPDEEITAPPHPADGGSDPTSDR